MLPASAIPVPPAIRLATFDVDIDTVTMFADKQDLMMELDCVMHELVTSTSQEQSLCRCLIGNPA